MSAIHIPWCTRSRLTHQIMQRVSFSLYLLSSRRIEAKSGWYLCRRPSKPFSQRTRGTLLEQREFPWRMTPFRRLTSISDYHTSTSSSSRNHIHKVSQNLNLLGFQSSVGQSFSTTNYSLWIPCGNETRMWFFSHFDSNSVCWSSDLNRTGITTLAVH